MRRGQRFADLVGPEFDRADPSVAVPRPIDVLAHSPLTCGGVAGYADSAYYTSAGGAGVFAAGTMRWVCALTHTCGHGVGVGAQRLVGVTTTNLLRVFAAGPAGLTRPAHDNLAVVHEAAGFAGTAGPTEAPDRAQWWVPSWMAFTTRSSTDRTM